MLISLCMIVKNEEENMKECLDRALNFVDEAIIVDTGSTDKTRDVLKRYEENCKVTVIDYIWENDFSKARNKSIENAKGDYILILDADERFFCDRQRLEDFLRENDSMAYLPTIYNMFEGKGMVVSSGMIRIYKNHNPSYAGAIHEQLFMDGEMCKANRIDESICKIYHFGYSSKIYKEKDKQKRNTDIINEEIERRPNDPFNWYNKGVMESNAGNYESALDDFIKAHNLCKGVRMYYHDDLTIRIIQCLLMLKEYQKAIVYGKELVKDGQVGKMPDAYFYIGIAYKELKKYELSIKSFQSAIKKGEFTGGISKFGTGSYLSLLEWARVLKMNCRRERAIEKYKEAIFNANNIANEGVNELRELLTGEGRTDELNMLENELEMKASGERKPEHVNIELEQYKDEFKEQVEALMGDGLLEETKKMIEEYEQLVKDDVDMYSVKGVIAMMEGDNETAEKLLKDGLEVEPTNFDLLYNMAYLCEIKKEFDLAHKFYEESADVADEETEGEIRDKLKVLAIGNR